MPELNKFLDLEGLKVFWDQINEKKQNRTIWYNGKQILIEDFLNDLKAEIEKVQEEIGNIEELDQINEHISKIQSTLQEIDNQLNNLEENYVPESRTVAGIDLTNDISIENLQEALTTYPVLILNNYQEPTSTTVGKIGQIALYQQYFNTLDGGGSYCWVLAICRSISADKKTYVWEELDFIPSNRKIAGLSGNNIQTSALKNALGIDSIENTLNGNIKKENLSTEFMETGELNNCFSTASRDGVYRTLAGTYTILNNLCILNVGTTTFSGWWNLYFDLPVSPTDLTAEYFSEIYVIDSGKDICSISIDPSSKRLAIMPGPKNSQRGFTGDNELHFMFVYRIS